MPIHDWTRVEAGIFHAFHHRWITAISDMLNAGLLPEEYYALLEQEAAGFGPDVLTLQTAENGEKEEPSEEMSGKTAVAVKPAPPKTRFTAKTDREFYRRKKSNLVVRHVSGDHITAIIEIISPGNKASKNAFRAFTNKVGELLEQKIHLLILDLFPPTKRDPHGIHSALWEDIADETFLPPADKPLTLVAYESGLTVTAYIEPIAVGDVLPDMPLVLEPGAYVAVPLEASYQAAWQVFPNRWKKVIEAEPGPSNGE